MAGERLRRIELVDQADSGGQEGIRVGIGLLVGLFVGRNSLIAAATGSEQIEFAIGHFVLVVLVCVGGLLFVGNLHDRFIQRAVLADVIRQANERQTMNDDLVDPPST